MDSVKTSFALPADLYLELKKRATEENRPVREIVLKLYSSIFLSLAKATGIDLSNFSLHQSRGPLRKIIRNTSMMTYNLSGVLFLKAMIDTEIWSIAKKKPSVSSFSSQEDYLKTLRIHEEALKFFREKFPELEVYISTHQTWKNIARLSL